MRFIRQRLGNQPARSRQHLRLRLLGRALKMHSTCYGARYTWIYVEKNHIVYRYTQFRLSELP